MLHSFEQLQLKPNPAVRKRSGNFTRIVPYHSGHRQPEKNCFRRGSIRNVEMLLNLDFFHPVNASAYNMSYVDAIPAIMRANRYILDTIILVGTIALFFFVCMQMMMTIDPDCISVADEPITMNR